MAFAISSGLPAAGRHLLRDRHGVPDFGPGRLPLPDWRPDRRPGVGPLARPEQDKLVALNTMLAEDGASITVPAGADAGTLVLVSLGTGAADRAIAFHPLATPCTWPPAAA